MHWSSLTDWWLDEVRSDPAYETVVTPLLIEFLTPRPELLYLDLGCGDGRVMRTLAATGAAAHGIDMNESLAGVAGQAVVAELPNLPFDADVYDGAYSVLTLEHIPDHRTFFTEAGRVVRTGGVLAIVINHPSWTAPDSTPITDEHCEVLWRPGKYFSSGTTHIPAGDSSVTFHHRTMGELLTAAAEAGWGLERLVERPHHEHEDQSGIPRLLACRWRLLP